MRYVPDALLRAYDRSPGWSRSIGSSAYGLFKRFREETPRFRAFLRALEESQSWSRGQLEELQAARLRRIVRHAVQSVPYYRRLFSEHGISAAQIQGPADLHLIPLLSKETVRTRQAELLAEGADRRRLRRESTSGTTGSPLSIWIDDTTYDQHRAAQWLHHGWGGYTHREWIGVLAGYKVVPPARHHPPFWVTNYPGKQVHFSTYHLNPEWIPAYVRKLRSSRVRFLLGYPSAIGILARQMVARGETVPLEAVFLSSEPVYPWQAEAIRAAFGATICHYYGSTERAVSAGSCPETAESGEMHVNMELCVAEVVPDATAPDRHLLVGTSLTNFMMPLLRYETGDITTGIAGICRCGRQHQRIGPVETRTADYLLGANGSIISPWLVTRVFSPERVVDAFQIVQSDAHHITVRIVPGRGYSGADEDRLREKIEAQVGPGMTISFEHVTEIERTKNGKIRVVVSLMAVDDPGRPEVRRAD